MKKKVPLFVSRPLKCPGSLVGRVESVRYFETFDLFEVKCRVSGRWRTYFANRLFLAAGVYNNVRILQGRYRINATLSDHEVAVVGTVAGSELVEKRWISAFGFFAGTRRVHNVMVGEMCALVDFRPQAFRGVKAINANLYSAGVIKVLGRVLGSLSWSLVNQVIFNKFGVAIFVPRYEVVVQAVANNAIHMDLGKSSYRDRIEHEIWGKIAGQLALKSFDSVDNVDSIDGIHLSGSFDGPDAGLLSGLISSGKLVAVGLSSAPHSLGPFHTTHEWMIWACQGDYI